MPPSSCIPPSVGHAVRCCLGDIPASSSSLLGPGKRQGGRFRVLDRTAGLVHAPKRQKYTAIGASGCRQGCILGSYITRLYPDSRVWHVLGGGGGRTRLQGTGVRVSRWQPALCAADHFDLRTPVEIDTAGVPGTFGQGIARPTRVMAENDRRQSPENRSVAAVSITQVNGPFQQKGMFPRASNGHKFLDNEGA